MHTRSAAPRAPRQATAKRPAILGGSPAFDHEVLVTRPIVPNLDDYTRRVAQAFETSWLTNNGPLVLELEKRLTRYLEVGFCKSFSSGTSALLTALRALKLEGQVITTPFTFPATPHCIEWNGLEPVFCDIDPLTYNLDPERVEEAIDGSTSAIVPVHVFGNPCDVEGFDAIAARHGLPIVYDAAHTFGVRLDGIGLGCFGTLSAMSFHATKVFHTAEGGAIVGPDTARETDIALLRNFGILNENEVSGVGLNGKVSELHAAMGLLVLDRVEAEIEARRRMSERYSEALQDIEGLAFQQFAPGVTRNYFNLTIRIDADAFGLSRNQLHEALRSEGIISRRYFSPLCSVNECYRDLPSARPGNLPNAHRLSDSILSLPLYGTLSEDAVDRILDAILCLKQHAPGVRRQLGQSA